MSSIFTTTKEDLVSNAEEFYESFHRAERQANEKVFYEIIAATPNYKKYYITENKTFNVVKNYLDTLTRRGFI